ncbi:hypothetical protein L596_000759 [Steinernema carpocapsae]|uniref:Uncharacterized protein n=1 Tax=Steinernema carpocapsae TaxID=34508 RepID=A0A4U8UJE2_STECR|nr:hypothetical protein L596_000759 [Steinernema carpocapsae]
MESALLTRSTSTSLPSQMFKDQEGVVFVHADDQFSLATRVPKQRRSNLRQIRVAQLRKSRSARGEFQHCTIPGDLGKLRLLSEDLTSSKAFPSRSKGNFLDIAIAGALASNFAQFRPVQLHCNNFAVDFGLIRCASTFGLATVGSQVKRFENSQTNVGMFKIERFDGLATIYKKTATNSDQQAPSSAVVSSDF